ncbi:MAG: hypothetical protein ABIY50_01445 [Ignavibacteria bacterium]
MWLNKVVIVELLIVQLLVQATEITDGNIETYNFEYYGTIEDAIKYHISRDKNFKLKTGFSKEREKELMGKCKRN